MKSISASPSIDKMYVDVHMLSHIIGKGRENPLLCESKGCFISLKYVNQ